MIHGIIHTDTVKIVNLTTRQNGRKDFMLLRCSQNENGMAGRFFQCLQEGVESRGRQHVYLVNDIHFILTYLWRNTHLFHQLANIVYRVVGRRIQFMNVVRALLVESDTRLTFVAGFAICRKIHTVDGLGKNTCTSSFTHSARSAEQISMRQFLGGDSIFQCSGQCPLPHDRLKGGRTILTGGYDIVFHIPDDLCFLSLCKCTQKSARRKKEAE